MHSKKFCFVAVAAVTLTVLLGAMGRPAPAEQPAVPRIFAELTHPDALCQHWEAEDSKRIVAHRDGNAGDVIEFITPREEDYTDDDAIVRDSGGDVILDLRGTVWLRMPVVHVTASGAEEVRDVYWLLEDLDGDGESDTPGSGMTAPTGLEGDVIAFVTIRITQAAANDISNPNKYYLAPNGNIKLCVATGLFNK